MKHLRIGLDIDGCLADFNSAYRQTLLDVSGRPLIPEGFQPPLWDYAPFYGYTPEEDKRAWDRIKTNTRFWQTLQPLPGAEDLLELANVVNGDVYFLTNRPGTTAKRQTETWLRFYGLWEPTVLIAPGNKGKIAEGLQLTDLIDDRPENCFAVAYESPLTKVFLRAASYNEWARQDIVAAYKEWMEKERLYQDPAAPPPNITIVSNLDQFTEALREHAAV